ncbi:ChrR family anti-sigma-E factor [Spongiibacter taiwanensis]|uniref:ChrR family anti-sigma-E factor n=1 Tax=Spongiibacter taiwanensis TaxID=1748242 RepID=UPI0020362E03|nr:ChrR family anti-sigma-E factor [Spongiibacter taiwanensis]USA42749.1 ChrR family anti-sigma-E factor [Spongiibacter taiwanensis]
MSQIQHHPSDDTLASYSAGALPAALALVVGCHLEECGRCRRELSALDGVGGELLSALAPKPLSETAKARMLALLDEQTEGFPGSGDLDGNGAGENTRAEKPVAPSSVPRLLAKLTGSDDLDALPWKTVGPGVRQIVLHTGEGNSRLLRIGAGRKMPVHSHRGSELTMILRGGYSDVIGKFNAGDVADLDASVEHQPIADADEDCICLAGMDAPLKFQGWIAKLMQPFVGM